MGPKIGLECHSFGQTANFAGQLELLRGKGVSDIPPSQLAAWDGGRDTKVQVGAESYAVKHSHLKVVLDSAEAQGEARPWEGKMYLLVN